MREFDSHPRLQRSRVRSLAKELNTSAELTHRRTNHSMIGDAAWSKNWVGCFYPKLLKRSGLTPRELIHQTSVTLAPIFRGRLDLRLLTAGCCRDSK